MTTQETLAAAQQQVRDFLTETGIGERLSAEQLARINGAIEAATNVVETNSFRDAAEGTDAGDIVITDRSNGDIAGEGGDDLFLNNDGDFSTQEGGSGDDVFLGGEGFIENVGGDGDDFAVTDGTSNSFAFDGGDGNDELAVLVDEAVAVLVRALRSGPETLLQFFTNDEAQSFLNAVSAQNTETIGLTTGDQADDIDLSGVGRGDGNFDVNAGGGADNVVGSINSDTVRGGTGDDTVSGGAQSGQKGDQLFGEGGNDTANVASTNSNSFFDGGADEDTVNVEGTGSSDQVTIDFEGTKSSLNRFDSFGQTVQTENVENVNFDGREGSDEITTTGVDGNGTFTGGTGQNTADVVVDEEEFRSAGGGKLEVKVDGDSVDVNLGTNDQGDPAGTRKFVQFQDVSFTTRSREDRQNEAAENLANLQDVFAALAAFADAIDPFGGEEEVVGLIRDLLRDFGSIFDVDPGTLNVALQQVNLVIEAAEDAADRLLDNDVNVSDDAAQDPGFLATVQEAVAAVDFLLIGEKIGLGFLSSNQLNKVDDIAEGLANLLPNAFSIGAIPDDIFAKVGATLVSASARVFNFNVPNSEDVISQEELAALGEDDVSIIDVIVGVSRIATSVIATLPLDPDTVQQVVNGAVRIINDPDASLSDAREALQELARLKELIGVEFSEIGVEVNIDEDALTDGLNDGVASKEELDFLRDAAEFAADGDPVLIPEDLARALVEAATRDLNDPLLAGTISNQTGIGSIGDGSPEALADGRQALEQALQTDLSIDELSTTLAGLQRIENNGGEPVGDDLADSIVDRANQRLAEEAGVTGPSFDAVSALENVFAQAQDLFPESFDGANPSNLLRETLGQDPEVDTFSDLEQNLSVIEDDEAVIGETAVPFRQLLGDRIAEFVENAQFAPGDALKLFELFRKTISPLSEEQQVAAATQFQEALEERSEFQPTGEELGDILFLGSILATIFAGAGTVIFENGQLIDNQAELLERLDELTDRLNAVLNDPNTSVSDLGLAAVVAGEFNTLREQIEQGSAGDLAGLEFIDPVEFALREALRDRLAGEEVNSFENGINVFTESTTDTGEQRNVGIEFIADDRVEGEFNVDDFNIRFETELENVRFDVKVGDGVEIDLIDEDGNKIGDFDVDAETTNVDFSGAENASEVSFTSDDGSVGVLSDEGTQVTFDNGVVFDISDLDIVGDAAPVVDGDGGDNGDGDNGGDVNVAPSAEDDAFQVTEDAALENGANLFDDNGNGQDNDPDGDAISVVEVRDEAGEAFAVGEAHVLDQGGILTVFADGRVAFDPADAFQFLAADETQEIQFSYTISDGEGGTDVAEARIVVQGLNDAPEAADDTAEAPEDTAITTGNVLLNDADIDGDQLTIARFDAVSELGSTITDNGDGTFGYIYGGADLAPGEVVIDSFTYTVSDGELEDTATVSVTVTGAADDVVDLDLRGSLENDELTGGAGADRLFGRGGDDALFGEAGDDRLVGGAGDDTAEGGSGDDMLVGDKGDDTLEGDGGDDRLLGGDGDDTLDGGLGNDNLNGGRDADQLFGGDGDDRLLGGAGDDQLFGGLGADRLIGNDGSDLLHGGAGADVLLGGAGSDVFQFSESFGADQVRDFALTEDLLDFSGIDGLNSISDVEILERSNGTLIQVQGEGEVLLTGVDAATLEETHFLF